MKKIILLQFIALAATAQVKVFNTNQISLGYLGTTPPPSNVKTHLVGNTLFTQTSTGTGGAFITGNNGVSGISTPDYSWNGDLTTGIFHPSNGNMGITISGEDVMKFTAYKRVYLGCNPASPLWEDGRLTISPIAGTNEAAIKINANHLADYGRVVDVVVSRNNTIAYKAVTAANSVSSPGTCWYVTGAGWNYGTGFYVGSDINLKQEINPLKSSIEVVRKMRGVSYYLKSEVDNPNFAGTAKIQYGFIAQELEKIFPESSIVSETESGIKAVNYLEIIPFLVEAIKEQQSQIETLKTELESSSQTGLNNNISSIETKAQLFQNIPNPFNEKTSIRFNISNEFKQAKLYVYNMNGLQILEFPITKNGQGEIIIEGSKLEAGMYLYALIIDNKEVETKRMILTK